jgi:hypothetical protein
MGFGPLAAVTGRGAGPRTGQCAVHRAAPELGLGYLSAVVLALVASLPYIHDITTDVQSPPSS